MQNSPTQGGRSFLTAWPLSFAAAQKVAASLQPQTREPASTPPRFFLQEPNDRFDLALASMREA